MIKVVDNALGGIDVVGVVGVVVVDHQTKCPVHRNACRVLWADLQVLNMLNLEFLFSLHVCDGVLDNARTRARVDAAARLSENGSRKMRRSVGRDRVGLWWT